MSTTTVTTGAAPRRAARPLRVLADLLGGTRLRDIALVLAGTVLITVVGRIAIPLPFTPVPISLATLGVVLTGAALGPVRALASSGLYLVLGLLGAPMFAGGAAGWAFSSFGYIIGYVLAATVVGWLAQRGWDRSVWRMAVATVLGFVLVYVAGLAWLVPFLGVGLREGIVLGVVPFLIGDALKTVVAAAVLPVAWNLVPRA